MSLSPPKTFSRPEFVRADTVALWRISLTLVLSVAVPLYLIASTHDIGRGSAWILALRVAAWSGFRLAQRVSDGSDRYAVLMFWIFNYIFFGLAPLVQLRTGLLPTTTPKVSARYDERTMLVIIASLVAFEIGSKFGSGTNERSHIDSDRKTHVPARVVTGLLDRAGAGLGVRGPSGHHKRRGKQVCAFRHPKTRVARSRRVEIAYAAAFVPLLVGAHLLLLARTRSELVGNPTSRRGLLLLVFATLAVVVNPFGSARFIFGGVWLSLLAQKKIATTVRARRHFSFAIVVGFVFVFPIADRFSRPGRRQAVQGAGGLPRQR